MGKRLAKWFKRFFFPPEGTPLWLRALPYAILGLLTLVLLISGAYAWEYTNSPEFCGEACHTMPPEYTAYLTSPHARVDCVECHIGRGFIATRITRKAGDLKHVFATVFMTYEFPIHADQLRPARETCEQCHFPEKFSDDSLREITRFQDDPNNTLETTYLIMETGGGSERLGLGRGIHWHIVNKVEYYALDQSEQVIPYVRVVEDDGTITEYLDVESGFDPQSIAASELVEMDCITCHNRITHLVATPEDTVDQLITRGLISRKIPWIRKNAVEAYSQIFATTGQGLDNIAKLVDYYQEEHADFYQANQDLVEEAVKSLQEAYANSVYPEQNSDWTTHPNNAGHKDSPGCLRCHGGKHLNAEDEAIRLECNICHSIPVVTGPTDFLADIEISLGPEPSSHLNPNWISLHRDVFDPTCVNCHTVDNPGGVDNSSFCSNSACHGNVWEYAGFDAPELRRVLIAQLPPTPTPTPIPTPTPTPDPKEEASDTEVGDEPEVVASTYYGSTIAPLFEARCGSCHGSSSAIMGLDLTSYQAAMAGGESGPAIIPGEPDNSPLIQIQSGEQTHFGQFTPEELLIVSDWIAAGASEE